MAKATKQSRSSGFTKKIVKCSFCGGKHRNGSAELSECRRRHRRGEATESATAIARHADRKPGDETTRYLNDPLRGNKNAHAIVKGAKAGYPPRRIAKLLDLDLQYVKAVLAKRAGS